MFEHGAIYTQEAAQPWAQAIAVAKGRIVAVGSDAELQAWMGPTTRRVDLQGRMLMPGLIDAHVHAGDGAMAELFDCLFASDATPEQIRPVLAKCVKGSPRGAWIIGGHWDSDFFNRFKIGSPRRWLDAIAGEHPVLLWDDAFHNIWVNSAALQAAHVDAATADPAGGRFEREPGSREPNGLVIEAAAEGMKGAVPLRSASEYRRGVLRAQDIAHRFGIIGFKDADADPAQVAAYHSADSDGKLSVYVAACIKTQTGQDQPDALLNFAAIDEVHRAHQSDLLDTRFVKIFLDGVPTPARTAAMLAPYLPDSKGERTSGMLHVNPAALAQDLIELDRRGYTVKMHATGDRAIRAGLDAIAAARAANPASTLRHELAHAGYIDDADLPRFAQLNAVAELSPVIWYPSPIIDAVISAVGERGKRYWPMRTLVASRAPLAAGSDWPSVVPSMDPWSGVESMVTRSDPLRHSSSALWPEESVTLADALRIYTMGGAAALRREDQTGSIKVGKSADFIVLDRNLFKVPAQQISDVRVLMTYFQGRKVYSRQPAAAATPLASIQELMLTRIDPAADVLWESVATISNAAGVEDRQPRTDAQWDAVRRGALALIEGADALTVRGRPAAPVGSKTEGDAEAGVESVADMRKAIDADPPRFANMARALRLAGEEALAAIERRDAQALFDVGGKIDEACEQCHRAIWYPRSP